MEIVMDENGAVWTKPELHRSRVRSSTLDFLKTLAEEYYQTDYGVPAAVVRDDIYDAYVESLEEHRRHVALELMSTVSFEGITLYRVSGLPVPGQLLTRGLSKPRPHAGYLDTY